MSADALQFDPAQHRYTLGGEHLPSVTQVLDDVLDLYRGVDRAILEAAQVRGTHVHLACELDDRGVLDESALAEEYRPYLKAWRRFRFDSGFEIQAIEERVYHAALGYAGTLDRRGLYRGRTTILDIKSNAAPASVGAQTAAYDRARASMTGSHKPALRLCVELRADGMFRMHRLTDSGDWPLFLSCLNVHKWKKHHAR